MLCLDCVQFQIVHMQKGHILGMIVLNPFIKLLLNFLDFHINGNNRNTLQKIIIFVSLLF